jgi:hypothetical protein
VVEVKPDAQAIRDFLSSQVEEDWIRRSERRVWPQFVFHYTDIRNAAEVLKRGYLYSRKYVEDHNMLPVSSGSPDVLANTKAIYRDYVRLYFRPKTPTQYYMEGIRSRTALEKSRYPKAHCPVPVFFLLDAAKILIRSDCEFSNGGLNNPRAEVFSTASDLARLPWMKIYHTGWHDPGRTEESDIPFRRNAEVIVRRRLELAALRYIYCRSEAEKETLLNSLESDLRDRYASKTVATTRSDLFYRKHTFVESARLNTDTARFQFSPDTESPGPFHLQVEIKAGSHRYPYEDETFLVPTRYNYRLRYPQHLSWYTISLHLDRYLAYYGKYEEVEIPF